MSYDHNNLKNLPKKRELKPMSISTFTGEFKWEIDNTVHEKNIRISKFLSDDNF